MTKKEQLKRIQRSKQILPTDKKLMEMCVALRHRVEHPNESSDIILQQGIYKQKDPEAILTVRCDGVEVGYKVKSSSPLEVNHFFDRYVYLKIPGYRLQDLSAKQLASIKTALYSAFLEPQQGPITIKILAEDSMMMAQRFMVAFWKAGNPGIVKTLIGVDVKNGMVINA